MSGVSFIAIIFLIWCTMAGVVAMHADGQNKTPWWGAVVLLLGIFGMLFYAISLASD